MALKLNNKESIEFQSGVSSDQVGDGDGGSGDEANYRGLIFNIEKECSQKR